MSSPPAREGLLQLLRPVVETGGVDLEDVVVTPAGKRRLVRVVVDRDGGLDLDAVAVVSRAVSDALDAAEGPRSPLGSAPYVLEVTTPGVDRALTEARHWRRARTRLVAVELADGSGVTGRVLEVDDAGVLLDVEGTTRLLPVADLVRGRVQVEFNRPGAEPDAEPDADTDTDTDLGTDPETDPDTDDLGEED